MTRKYIILFVVFSLIFYSLISSFLGERGIIANNQLKRQLIENEYELDRRKVQLENLRIKEQELATEDGLRSAAMNLGYQVDSDNVFIFDNEEATISQTQDFQAQNTVNNQETNFNPWSSGTILLISFCSSFIITLLLWLFRKKENDDSEQDQSGNFGNNFNID